MSGRETSLLAILRRRQGVPEIDITRECHEARIRATAHRRHVLPRTRDSGHGGAAAWRSGGYSVVAFDPASDEATVAQAIDEIWGHVIDLAAGMETRRTEYRLAGHVLAEYMETLREQYLAMRRDVHELRTRVQQCEAAAYRPVAAPAANALAPRPNRPDAAILPPQTTE